MIKDGNKYKSFNFPIIMNIHLNNYLKSFKNKSILKVFLYDAIFWLIIVGIFAIFLTYYQKRSLSLASSPQELQKLILSAPAQAQEVISQLNNFLFTFIGGFFILLLLSLFLYSYTRKKKWNYLSNNKTKYWRWNALNLILLIIYIILIPVF